MLQTWNKMKTVIYNKQVCYYEYTEGDQEHDTKTQTEKQRVNEPSYSNFQNSNSNKLSLTAEW